VIKQRQNIYTSSLSHLSWRSRWGECAVDRWMAVARENRSVRFSRPY